MNIDKFDTSAGLQSDSKPLILVADDSKVVRISLKNILQQDYTILEAEDGVQAWNVLNNETELKLVFSDLSMPNLDGLGLLNKIRQADEERIRKLPFIVVTGKDEDEQIRNQLLREGANDLISKPFIEHEIMERAKRHIKHPQNQAESDAGDDEFLTGISNKARFNQIARKELSFAIRNKNELALLLLKLDQFETIKNHYSEPAIEHILITTAEIIRSHTHIEDKIAYFGEGTFALLLPAANAIGTRYLGKRLLADLLAKKFYLAESDATVTASVGVSAPDIKPTTNFSEILHLAEQRLQAAINAGGQRVVDKGNATITPISTLQSSDKDSDPTQQRILTQTEQQMRQLASQELDRMKAGSKLENEVDSSLRNVQELNDALLLAEQENKLIKDELVRLRLQAEEMERLKKQLHETGNLLQQTQLKYKQLRTEYSDMCNKFEEAESRQSELSEPNFDNSIIEQHLLQENEQLQKEYNAANQRAQETHSAFRKSALIISNLKQQLQLQKDEFELAMAEANMKRSMAEERVAELEAGLTHSPNNLNHLSLTPVPLTSTGRTTPKAQTNRIGGPAPEQPVLATDRIRAGNTAKRPVVQDTAKKPHPTSFLKIIAIVVLLAVGMMAFLYWQQLKTATIESIQDSSYSPKPPSIVVPAESNDTEVKNARGEARLQVEMAVREAAEEEYQLLLLQH